MKQVYEWQFDGLVGPTHNYAGLAYGNVAAITNAGAVSNPRMAALQGLEKMKFVRDLGMKQCFLLPHYRPIITVLKRIGFDGDRATILETAAVQAPHLLASVYSSAFMWVANAATIAPSADTLDGKLHVTPANLISNFHRSLESAFNTKQLRRIFRDSQKFVVHDALPQSILFSDEGAANHMLATKQHGARGLHIFVYGMGNNESIAPRKYPARQQRAAFEAIARNHGLAPEACVYVQQNPDVIDLGVFHNDVIAMNTTRLMIAHTQAFTPAHGLGDALKKLDASLDYITISDEQLTVAEAVKTYFFNSQLLDRGDGRYLLIAPSECEEHPRAKALLDSLSGGNGPLHAVHYRDVRESMRNGGGPACLRLRVVMTEDEAAAMHQGVMLTDATYDALVAWVKTHYRDRLCFDDLRDPHFIDALNEAYAALEEIVGMPGIYDL